MYMVLFLIELNFKASERRRNMNRLSLVGIGVKIYNSIVGCEFGSFHILRKER